MKNNFAYAVLTLSLLAGCGQQDKVDHSQFVSKADFQATLEKTLIDNPEMLKKAFEALQKHDEIEKLKADLNNVRQYDNEIFNQDDPSAGADNGLVTIAYFSDPNCGYCKKFDPVLDRVLQDFPELTVKYKTVPILGKSSFTATQYLLNVWENEPKHFKEVKHKIMTNKGRLNDAVLKNIASSTNTNHLLNKASSKTVNEKINKNLKLMRDLNMSGTPSLVINNQVIRGAMPYEQLNKMIEQLLVNK